MAPERYALPMDLIVEGLPVDPADRQDARHRYLALAINRDCTRPAMSRGLCLFGIHEKLAESGATSARGGALGGDPVAQFVSVPLLYRTSARSSRTIFISQSGFAYGRGSAWGGEAPRAVHGRYARHPVMGASRRRTVVARFGMHYTVQIVGLNVMDMPEPAAAGLGPHGTVPDDYAEDTLVEMAYLDEAETGISGTVFVSTALGSHGPRVEWYPGSPGHTSPCLIMSIAALPKVRDDFLPAHVSRPVVPQLLEWVRMNHVDLLRFWNEGESWNRRRVSAFLDGLQPVRR